MSPLTRRWDGRQGGFGTKLQVLCDASGWLLTVALTPGQTHETQAPEFTTGARGHGEDRHRTRRGPVPRARDTLLKDRGSLAVAQSTDVNIVSERF